MDEKLRKNAEEIIRTLTDKGYIAYFAGGCVRDMIMSIEPKDYDITTNAEPEEIKRLFKRTILVGAKFGVIVVVKDGINYEVATFRSEIGYKDGRHPDKVIFTDEKEDVKRRDFTINGLLFDPLKNRIIDYVGGKDDINNKIIRTIGNPFERFNEDKLRMMRAVRLAVRFGFDIEENTFNAVKCKGFEISEISKERIRDELVKILTEGAAGRGIKLLDKAGMLKVILPEVADMKGVEQPKIFHPEGDVFTHTVLMLDLMENPSVELAMGALLHDVGKPETFEVKDRIRFNEHTDVGVKIASDICKRLRFTSKEIEHILNLIKNHLKFKDVTKMKKSTLKRFLSMEKFEEHLELHRLDCLASHKNLANLEYCRKMLKETTIEEAKSKRLINGDDLINAGFTPGPLFKEILYYVEDEQLEGRIKDKNEAMNLVIQKFGEKKLN